MNDDRLRALERRWQETGSDEDELAWDLERSRRGLPPRVTVVALTLQIFDFGDAGLDEESGAESWERVVAGAAERGFAPWLVCDLSGLRSFQSSAIVTYLEAHKRLEGLGGGLVLCEIPEPVWGVFQLLGYEELLPVSASVADCLRERGWERRGASIPIELHEIM